MSVVHVNSISGITSITAPSSSDVLTLHSSNTSEKVRITSGGVTQITKGTSGGATANTDAALIVDNSSNTYVQFRTPDSVESGLLFGDDADNDAGAITYDHSSNHLGFRVNASERVRIDSSGRMGLGSASPGSYNSNGDNLVIRSSGTTGLTLSGGGTDDCNIFFSNAEDTHVSAQINYDNDSNRLRITAGESNGEITFCTVSSNERVRITSAGKVGIGTTNPDQLLSIGDGSTTTTMSLKAGASNSAIINFGDPADPDVGQFYYYNTDNCFRWGTNGTVDRMTFDSSGRLLIGTTTEGEATSDNLTIADSGNCGITIRSGDDDEGNIYFSDGTSGDAEYRGMIRYDHDGDNFYIKTAATTALTISSSQNATFAGTVTDDKGDLRDIPLRSVTGSAATLVAADAGKVVSTNTTGWTVPASTFAEGDTVTLLNNSAGGLVITCSAVTTYLTSDGTTVTSSTLGARGLATLYFVSASVAYLQGTALS